MSDITDSIVLRCTCGAKLKLKSSAAGKRVRCPKCQTVLTVPAAADSAETYELRQEEPDSEPDLLAGLQSAAKIMVFAFVVHAVFTGDTSDPQLKRDYVALQRTEEILRERNAFTQDDREAQWDSASAEAERSVGRMSDSEVEQKWAEYQEKDEREDAFADETGAKCARLARHRARLRARGEGLSPYSEQEDRYFNEEFSKLRSSDEATIASETERLDAWEKGEVWANPDDVRTHLIYQRIDERMAEEHRDSDDEWEYPQGREWKRLYQEIAAEVDAMGFEEQVALGKRIVQEQKDESMRSALAWHCTDVLGKRQGLYFGDDRWEVLREEQRAAVDQISSEELTAEHEKLQQWNDGGMWQDAEHVRDRLIYEYANQRIADHREAQGDGDLDEAFPTADD